MFRKPLLIKDDSRGLRYTAAKGRLTPSPLLERTQNKTQHKTEIFQITAEIFFRELFIF
jgi:hypothetical protein